MRRDPDNPGSNRRHAGVFRILPAMLLAAALLWMMKPEVQRLDATGRA